MRIILTALTVILALISGWAAYAYVGLHYPAEMHKLILVARKMILSAGGFDVPVRYQAMVDLLLSDRQLILMGFIVAAATALGFIRFLLGAMLAAILGLFNAAFLNHAP